MDRATTHPRLVTIPELEAHGTMVEFMKKAIIIGATSGIGRELARVLAEEGYQVGVTGRRQALLEALAGEFPGRIASRPFDISAADSGEELQSLIDQMEGVDLVVINAGTGKIDPDIPWENEESTIRTNVLGFARMANVAFQHFRLRGAGHLAGVSSIAGIRGGGGAPAYSASKAFVCNYLQGLRYISEKGGHGITVTDIQPGFVDTAMAQGDHVFWSAPPRKAALQICRALEKKRNHVYITRRWRLIAWILKFLPEWVLSRLT